MTLAVIKTGGKQYLAQVGQKLTIEKIVGADGSNVTFDDVLLFLNEDKLTVGHPRVEGARVGAVITKQGRGKKIIVQKYKPKVRYQKKLGHRQPYTEVIVKNIELRAQN